MRTEKREAIALRKKGKSYNEISKALRVPKSTLSTWLTDIKISVKVKKELWNRVRNKRSRNITKYNKQRAIIAQRKAQKIQALSSREIKNISKKDLFLIGIALYWAEGHKKSRWRLDFTNSDPEMIRLEMKFFREICKVEENKFSALVQTHYNIDPESVVNYWSKISGIPKKQFIKTYQRKKEKKEKKYTVNILPFGTLRVSISDMEITNKMKGWINGISSQF